jgi:SAM-dependent methyltransferase
MPDRTGPAGPDFRKAERCPICLGPNLRPYRKGNFDHAALRTDQVRITDSEYGKIWDLSVCDGCGHIFADPCPLPEFLASLYARVEDPQYDEEAEGRSENFAGILDRLEARRPEKGNLFDVGAATGILLDLARRRGWRPDGIEPSAWAVRFAASKYSLVLRPGELETADLPAGSFQAVTMVDVIEHTPRAREAAAAAARLLVPGGLLCLVTPDIHSRAARLAGRRWWHYRPGHVAYFSETSLRVLLESAGLRLTERRRYAWTFSARYLASRLPLLRVLARGGPVASFLKGIRVRLALGDSFEIYAVKDESP